MRGETKPEDKILGVVLARLKRELGFTFDEMSAETGIPAPTLSQTAGSLFAMANPGRISKIADYFQRIHGLDYVNERYLLNGGAEDQARIENLKKEYEIKKKEERRFLCPPMLILTGQDFE